MLSRAAREELQQYADSGRLDLGISLTVAPIHPELGRSVKVEWDFTHLGVQSGLLDLPGGVRMSIPPAGVREVAVDSDPARITVSAGGEMNMIEVAPRVITPRVARFDLPAQAFAGEPMHLIWDVRDAERCCLVIYDASATEHEVCVTSHMDYVPQRVGELRVGLLAASRHAQWSSRACIAAERRVTVNPPRVHIEVSRQKLYAPIGSNVVFHWKVTGAARVFLRALTRGEEHAVKMAGHVVVEVVAEQEDFLLIVKGTDGREYSRQFQVIPSVVEVEMSGQLDRGYTAFEHGWRYE